MLLQTDGETAGSALCCNFRRLGGSKAMVEEPSDIIGCAPRQRPTTLWREVKRNAAFSLIELLVVIGIIAVLIAIIVPTLSRARDSGRAATCLANLRTMGQATASYQTANNGSMPWGQAVQDKVGYALIADPKPAIVTWYTLLSDHLQPTAAGAEIRTSNAAGAHGPPGDPYGLSDEQVSDSLQCPSVVAPSLVHFAANPNVFVNWPAEVMGVASSGGATSLVPAALDVPDFTLDDVNAVPRAGKASQLYADNALFWDTPAFHNLPDAYQNRAISLWSYAFLDFDGFAKTLSYGQDDDVGQMTRYRDRLPPLYQTDPEYGDGFPVFAFRPDADPFWEQYGNAPLHARPTDAGGFTCYVVQIGNVRWRHGGDRVSNVAFNDGSVRGLRWNPSDDHPYNTATGSTIYADNEFKRAYYRVKPSGRILWERGT